MRTHSLIEVNLKFLIEPYLLMAGQKQELEVLETSIENLLNDINTYQPHITKAIHKLLPIAISSTNWTGNQPLISLKKSLISEITPKISNALNDLDIFKMIVEMNFPSETNEKNTELDLGLIHQIKCQIRLRNLDILSQDVEKVINC